MKIALRVTAILSLIVILVTGEIENTGKLIAIGCLTGTIIRCIALFLLWISVSGLLVMFLREKREKTTVGKTIKAILLALFDVSLTIAVIALLLTIPDWMKKAEKLKSPDGEHYIVRVAHYDLFGHKVYNFYTKDKGIIYEYAFNDDNAEPELEWTDNGVLHRGWLYEC